MKFELKPVAWMSTIVGVLVAVMALDDTLEQAGAGDIVPTSWEPYVLGAIAVLTAILGKIVHNRVTPLASPKNDQGYPLAPVEPVGPGVREDGR